MLRHYAYKRSDRISELIKAEIADIIQNKMKDPLLGQYFVTVSRVKISDDLQNGLIFISILQESEKKEEVVKALNRAKGFIRGELSRRIRMKNIPDILFKLDTSMEYADKINRILNEVLPDKKSDEDESSSGDN